MSTPTERHVLMLDLHDEAEAIRAYRMWHRPGGPPAAVTRSIRESDIRALEIWQVGDRLCMIMETGPAFSAAAKAQRDATDPDVRAWETLMDQFQRRLPFAPAEVKWVPAERIYTLAEQP
ncbi:L-rhamnose mutarotase [Novosphingobium sp. SG916]|nr:L-rhamnose mutarotase [Novosphingobium sp. SG919]NMN85384.1 L-rhamnose mutarotase [Novosphingobium sp. SG916]